ncbi:MAG: PepSY-like domain-containing protein [Bacteroidia bacterium]
MKKLFLISTLFLLVFSLNAQKVKENKVPEKVKSALIQQYPKADEIKWEKENNAYEAEFEMNEIEYSVLINESGTITETEIEIKYEELPQAVKTSFKAEYPEKKIKEVSKITMSDGTVSYEVEINSGDLIYNSNGELISSEKKSD